MAGKGEGWSEDQERTVEFDRVHLEADALEDLAASNRAANPDVTAGLPDQAWWEETVRGMVYRRDGRLASQPGQPGTGVRPIRAAWWERAVESGRGSRPAVAEEPAAPELPPEPRRPAEPTPSTSKPAPAHGWERTTSLQRSPKPASPIKPERALRPGRPPSSDYATGPIPVVSPERPIAPQPRAVPERSASPAAQPAAAVLGPVVPDAGFVDRRDIPGDQPVLAPPVARRRPGRLMVGATAFVTILIAGGVVALVLSSRHQNNAGPAGNVHMQRQAARNQAARRAAILAASERAQAAIWVAAQVSHQVNVSCDPVMCQGLIQQGFPSHQLVRLVPGSPDPLHSAVVVMTPTLRHQFGGGFDARWAPVELAGFGVGADLVTVQVIAPHGAAAYEAGLSADLRQRIAAGAAIVNNSQISIAPASKRAVMAGLVDPRILSLIIALAAQHPVNVLAFGKNFAGTAPGTPFRVAVFAETVPAAGLTTSQYAASMISLLHAQSAEYRPLRITTVRLPSGRPGLEVQYAAPTPLGLLHY